MAMILLNSADLLRVDLKGVNVILPDLVVALEAVLGDQELKISAAMSKADLRRNSISLLISMIYLPLHFEVRIELFFKLNTVRPNFVTVEPCLSVLS